MTMHAEAVGFSSLTRTSDIKTMKKLALNHRRNKQMDHTALIDETSAQFDYGACDDQYWNPEEFSFLYGTPLWDQASAAQKLILNHIYWVAYYAQIVSAEIATIYFNQTSAAGLYAIEDFRLVCDTLDLESAQERAHIAAFKSISEAVEKKLFGKRLFTYPMRSPFVETMIFHNSNRAKAFWKEIQLRAFGLLSSGNAFIGCQYFTIRGLRTLNGKLVQHRLSQFVSQADDVSAMPIPARISYYHFLDESHHFNSSMIISHDVVKMLKAPTIFEKTLINTAIRGCQLDHSRFSTAINGIFWYDPAIYRTTYEILRSRVFAMEHKEALEMLEKCFCYENVGTHASRATQLTAKKSYINFVDNLDFVTASNRQMLSMKCADINEHLRHNRQKLDRFITGRQYGSTM